MKNTAIILATLAAAGILAAAGLVGLNKQEYADCLKLEQQAKEYAAVFYLTETEDQMCRAHGIIINAPIK